MKTNISVSIEKTLYQEIKVISEREKKNISSIINDSLKETVRELKKKRLIASYKKSALKKTPERDIWERTIGDGIENE